MRSKAEWAFELKQGNLVTQQIVIADLTGHNPDVFREPGVRHPNPEAA
jgi:hypothetical protein